MVINISFHSISSPRDGGVGIEKENYLVIKKKTNKKNTSGRTRLRNGGAVWLDHLRTEVQLWANNKYKYTCWKTEKWSVASIWWYCIKIIFSLKLRSNFTKFDLSKSEDLWENALQTRWNQSVEVWPKYEQMWWKPNIALCINTLSLNQFWVPL